MLTQYIYLAQSVESGAGGGSGIVTIVYILTSISLIAGFIVGTYKYVQRQKKRWTEEGVTRERQAQATAENTAQMVKNTEAIDKLSGKFGEFATSVQAEMNGLGTRIEKLEVWRQNHNQFMDKKPE